jgi:hypothetical protein
MYFTWVSKIQSIVNIRADIKIFHSHLERYFLNGGSKTFMTATSISLRNEYQPKIKF